MISNFEVMYELKYNPKSKKDTRQNNVETFYTYHRMTIYDKTVYQNWRGEEGAITYNFDIAETLLEKYKSSEEVYRYLKRMQDNKKIYKVEIQAKKSLRFRDDEMGKYFVERKKNYIQEGFERSLAEKYANYDVKEEYLTPEGKLKYGEIQPQYNYYLTIFSKGLSGLLQQVFVSTLAYEAAGCTWPDGIERESFVFAFDPETKIATLKDIKIYNPDDPFNQYIRKSMRIVRKQPNEDDKKKDVVDYYLDECIMPWQRYEKTVFEGKLKSDDNVEGIYMLYDSKNGYFYVGKAERVFERMQQHRDSKEWIKDFDYYRYSLIDPYYSDDIFLIENAAIHDCAMILNMFANKDYCEKSLSVFLPDGKDIKEIYMVNSVKKQTKRPNKNK